MNLRQIGEVQLLARLIPDLASGKNVLAGAGDDCAVVELPRKGELLLLKTDCVVEGIHFAQSDKPAAVGWKAMMRPVSDFAAMSGIPQFALVTFVAPPEKTVVWATQLYRGLKRATRKFEIEIVGGETSATRGPAMISVSIAGFVEKDRWVRRSGGHANDDLFVTGRLGGSIRGKHLRFVPRLAEARWLTENFSIRAMIDLSDGLGVDLPRLAAASRLGFEIDEIALPRNRGCSIADAINDGEDFELLFAIVPGERARLRSKWRKKFTRLPLTRIGRLTRKSQIADRKSKWHGYVHFQNR